MKYYIPIVVILVSFTMKLLFDLEYFKKIVEINGYKNCQYLNTDILGPEKIVHYKNNVYFVGSGNLGKVLARGTPEMEQLGIYSIIIEGTQFSVTKVLIYGFPTNVALYAHGIAIYSNHLYVINHAYKNGGERVEIFQIDDKFNLQYESSILMGQENIGTLNDVLAVSDNRILVTRSHPYTDSIEGRQKETLWIQLKTLYLAWTKQKQTYVLDCTFEKGSVMIRPDCVQSEKFVMANGITWDGKETVWVADSILKRINEYQLLEEGLQFRNSIQFDHVVDNIYYDPERKSLIIGLILQMHGHLSLHNLFKSLNDGLKRDTIFKQYNGVGEYNLEKKQLEILLQNDNNIKGLSGGLIFGDYLLLSSWCDVSVMVCVKDNIK